MSAGSAAAAQSANRQAGGGATPTSALQTMACIRPRDLTVMPIDSKTARLLCEKYHYLRTYPGGALLNFGVFAGHALIGVGVLGVGSYNVHRLFKGAERGQVITLARFWLNDRCGRNSESRTVALILRQLRKHQSQIKAVVSYSDPMAGHDGCIYRAAGFLYLGKSSATPLYRFPDGTVHRSRTLGHAFGSHSLKHFARHGVSVEVVPQEAKHTYVACLDSSWRSRLQGSVHPYPKRLNTDKEVIPS